MSRLGLVLLGAVLLVAGVLARPRRSALEGGALTALGRSLGGARVLAADALFLRAEALRRSGRLEELPALYQTLVELDPLNTDALEVLAGELAEQALPAAGTLAGRLAWWREAWSLLERGMRLNPGSAALAVRAADLLLRVPEEQPGLAAEVERGLLGGTVEREDRGLALLLAAARDTSQLPRSGRLHLLRLARWAPLLAARSLERGEPSARAELRLGVAEELLWLHPAVLAEMQEIVEQERGSAEPQSVPVAIVLRAAIQAVRTVAQAQADGGRAEAQAALRVYVGVAGATDLAGLLGRLLERPAGPR